VKTLSNIQKNTATSLASRSSRCITFFLVISLYLLININNVYAAQVTLVWDHNNEPDLAGYKIYYGNSSRDYSKSIDITSRNITTCTIPDLIEGQTYYFAATAYNSNLVESDYSVEVSYTIDSTTTTVPVSECIIESVESTVLSLQSGLLKPRLRRIVITSTNSKWDDSSEIKINDINFVIRLRVEHDMITALILIPPRLLGFQPGVKDVTIVTGSEACIGTVEIE